MFQTSYVCSQIPFHSTLSQKKRYDYKIYDAMQPWAKHACTTTLNWTNFWVGWFLAVQMKLTLKYPVDFFQNCLQFRYRKIKLTVVFLLESCHRFDADYNRSNIWVGKVVVGVFLKIFASSLPVYNYWSTYCDTWKYGVRSTCMIFLSQPSK